MAFLQRNTLGPAVHWIEDVRIVCTRGIDNRGNFLITNQNLAYCLSCGLRCQPRRISAPLLFFLGICTEPGQSGCLVTDELYCPALSVSTKACDGLCKSYLVAIWYSNPFRDLEQ